jgi:hypothetical protein
MPWDRFRGGDPFVESRMEDFIRDDFWFFCFINPLVGGKFDVKFAVVDEELAADFSCTRSMDGRAISFLSCGALIS